MRIFVSYPSDLRPVAESIAFSLRHEGHLVFLDKDELPPGESYDARIRRAVQSSHLFIFLIAPQSLTPGRFTLTELAFAREEWPAPGGHVLPVVVRPTPFESIPAYLKAVSILNPDGNVAASVNAAVSRLGAARRKSLIKWSAIAAVPLVLAGGIVARHFVGAPSYVDCSKLVTSEEVAMVRNSVDLSGTNPPENPPPSCPFSADDTTTIEGTWCGRWKRTGGDWLGPIGLAKVRASGDTVKISYRDGIPYSLTLKREGDLLIGCYVNNDNSNEHTAWVGKIVNNRLIDGYWQGGRWYLWRQ